MPDISCTIDAEYIEASVEVPCNRKTVVEGFSTEAAVPAVPATASGCLPVMPDISCTIDAEDFEIAIRFFVVCYVCFCIILRIPLMSN